MSNVVIEKVEKVLTSEYSIQNYVEFVQEVFGNIKLVAPDKYRKEYTNFSSHIAGSAHVGNYTDPDGKKLIVFSVELINKTYVETSRSTQRSYAKKLIESAGADGALIAFYTEGNPKWRISFVRLDYEIKFENGKLKTAENMTPAKRYSYLVGKDEPCHTAIDRFRKFITDQNFNPTLDELEEAFSVEAVTNEFFNLYCEKFKQLLVHLEDNPDFVIESKLHNFTAAQFAKKLMGQIVFLYFLQKKGWLGVGAWPSTLTEKEYKNAFYARGTKSRELIPKVYIPAGEGTYRVAPRALDEMSNEDEAILAQCVKGKPWGSGPHNFMRKLFEIAEKRKANFFDDYLEPLFYNALNVNRGEQGYDPNLHCRIPFLSGGLFEPIDGYDWEHNDFAIPNEIFSNRINNNPRTGDGILDIFDRYNFTMSEDEPMEREVAIDPEMLGKVFENLLDVTDRKAKGAFYTPREIVHHMCQESLVNYLSNKMQINEYDIRDFILHGDLMKDEDTVKEKRLGNGGMYISETLFKIDEKGDVVVNRLYEMDTFLANVKVADPSVGSGAFPLGMLNEIVRARQNISAYLAIGMSSYDVRLMYQMDRSPHNLKYETIKNCIFAADIEPSAVDIAQLRLWLSLVIDDEINPNAAGPLEGHRNPLPLPNLECNILCGNSLIDVIDGVPLINQSTLIATAHNNQQINMFKTGFEKLLPVLIEEQDKLFSCADTERKKSIIENINELKKTIVLSQLKDRRVSDSVLQKYYESLDMASKPYVLWQLDFAKVFNNNGGFDIVIGNPPYGLLNKKQNQNTSIKATPEEVEFYKKSDLYKPAKGGMLNIFRLFICKSHDLLNENGHMSLIFPMAFMCDLSACELRKYLFKNAAIEYLEAFPERDNENKRVFRSAKMSVCILGSNKRKEDSERTFLMRINDDKFVNTSYPQIKISPKQIETIDEKGLTIPLINSMELSILTKMCTNAKRMKDFSKCYTGEIDLSLDKKYVRLEDNYHKMLRGAQVQRFFLTDNISQGDIFYLDSASYLENVHTPRSQHHKKKRIGMQGITGVNEKYRLKMMLINEDIFCANSVNYLLPEENLEYLLGLCNSHLLNWFFKKLSTNSNVNGYEVDNLPIVIADAATMEKVNCVVREMLATINEDRRENLPLEQKLNDLIYQIYNITEDEILEVEKGYE